MVRPKGGRNKGLSNQLRFVVRLGRCYDLCVNYTKPVFLDTFIELY